MFLILMIFGNQPSNFLVSLDIISSEYFSRFHVSVNDRVFSGEEGQWNRRFYCLHQISLFFDLKCDYSAFPSKHDMGILVMSNVGNKIRRNEREKVRLENQIDIFLREF